MTSLFKSTISGTLFLIIFLVAAASQAENSKISLQPQKNKGNKWQIAYYQGGNYIDYLNYFESTIKGLMKLSWIKQEELPSRQGEKIKPLWDWLSTKAKSDYLNFVQDGFYSAGWDAEKRKDTSAKLIQRLKGKKDIDLVLALGTWAGQDLANNKHSTPVIVMSASDPVGSGIIKSSEDSGYEHVHARVDPNRYFRQIKIFHEIIGF